MKKLTMLLLLLGCLAFAQPPTGKRIFDAKCARCHGATGIKGRFGAANLQVSRLGDRELLSVILKGKRWMPAWESRLSREEIIAVINYIKVLRQI